MIAVITINSIGEERVTEYETIEEACAYIESVGPEFDAFFEDDIEPPDYPLNVYGPHPDDYVFEP